jgi:hypothetical protein
LSLLKSGFLPIEQAIAFEIDLAARTRYLHDRKATWLERWPEEENAEALRVALAPLAAFDEAFHHAGVEELLDALQALLHAFEQNAVPAQPPLPDEQPAAAERYVALTASFTLAKAVIEDLRGLNQLLRGFRREDRKERRQFFVFPCEIIGGQIPVKVHLRIHRQGHPRAVMPGAPRMQILDLPDLFRGWFIGHCDQHGAPPLFDASV